MKYSLTCATLLAAQAIAHPFAHPVESSSNGIVRRDNAVSKYRPHAHGVYVGNKNIKALDASTAAGQGYLQTATSFAKKMAPKVDFRVANDHYVGANGVAHVYLKQVHNGIDIMNADMNINIAKDGTVLSYGNSFFDGELPSERLDTSKHASPLTAFYHARSKLNLRLGAAGVRTQKLSEHKYTLHSVSGANQPPSVEMFYYKTETDAVKPVWSISVDMWHDWYQAVIDAETGAEVIHTINYSKDASYKVYPWGCMDPTECERETLDDPWDKESSEFTWQGDGTETYHTTRGNNIIAQTNWNATSGYLNNYRPVSANDQFVYDFDLAETDFHKYGDASVTQLFYTTNMYHDLLHELGFDEQAGNFEVDVNGQGGKGGDFAITNAQDASGTDNANFLTPPDGTPGRMRMYMWDLSTPKRDGAFDAAIVIHEYTHGLSTRLTGGPANSDCLNTLEAGGMGEGWGDSMGNAVRIKPDDTRDLVVHMSSWAINNATGIRQYPYATSEDVDPWTYGDINTQNEVHDVGEIWATTLYELLWNLVDEYPIDDAIRPVFDNGVPTTGQFLYMKLVIDGMALQPCNPTFVQARDAILDADKALTDSKNQCLIWKAFAKRGVGQGAASSGKGTSGSPLKVTESFDVPAECN